MPVDDPHLLKLGLSNVGPSDVATAHFDSGRPIVFTLHCTMYGLMHASHAPRTVSTAVGSEGVVELHPGLPRRRESWTIEAVVSGTPAPTLDSSLIDTDIVDPATLRAAELPLGLPLSIPMLGLSFRGTRGS